MASSKGTLKISRNSPSSSLRSPLVSLLRDEQLDRLVGVGDGGVDDAEARPLGGGVAGLLQQLALRGVEVRLARLELAGRDLDELAAAAGSGTGARAARGRRRTAARSPPRRDGGCTRASTSAAVGQAHAVAVHLEQHAVVDGLAGDEMLGQVLLQSALDRVEAERHQRLRQDAEAPAARGRWPTAARRTPSAAPASGAASFGSSKYMSLTMRR